MRLHELVERMDLPATRVADGAWEAAARRVRRRRVGGLAAAGATVVAVLATSALVTRPDAGPGPSDTPTPSPPATSTPPTAGPRIVTPEMASPHVYDPPTFEALLDAPVGPPADAPALSTSPIPYAKLAMTPSYESTDVFVLGPDDGWRRLDVPLEQVTDGLYAGTPFRSTALSPDATRLALPQPSGLVVVDLTDGSHVRHEVPAPHLAYANWLGDSRVVVATEVSSRGWEVDLDSREVTRSDLGPSTGTTPDGRLLTWGTGDHGYRTQLRWDDGSEVLSAYNNSANGHPFPPLVGDDVVVAHHATTHSGLGLPIAQNAVVVVERTTGNPLAYLPTNVQKGDAPASSAGTTTRW